MPAVSVDASYFRRYYPYFTFLRLSSKLPMYDERFTGYGMNKISHVIELGLLGQVSSVTLQLSISTVSIRLALMW